MGAFGSRVGILNRIASDLFKGGCDERLSESGALVWDMLCTWHEHDYIQGEQEWWRRIRQPVAGFDLPSGTQKREHLGTGDCRGAVARHGHIRLPVVADRVSRPAAARLDFGAKPGITQRRLFGFSPSFPPFRLREIFGC